MNQMCRRALVAVLSLVASAACGTGTPQPASPVTAAVVRGDGYLVPFATYADGAWQGPPVDPGASFVDVPTIADRSTAWFEDRLPLMGSWEIPYPLGLTDEPRGTFTASVAAEPANIQSHCQTTWALTSNLTAESTPEFTVHRVDAAAFSRPVETTVVAEISTSPDLTSASHEVLEAAFNAAERAELARRDRDGGYTPRTAGPDAATTPLAYEALHRVGGRDGWSIYLFRAARTYPPSAPGPPDRTGCDEASVMTGWLAESPWGGFTILSYDLQMTDCDRKGSPLLRPLATVTLDGLTYVIVVARHYEGESYMIVEIEHDAIREVLSVDGGGC